MVCGLFSRQIGIWNGTLGQLAWLRIWVIHQGCRLDQEHVRSSVYEIAVMTSLRDGSSMEVDMSAAEFSASVSKSGEGVPAGWFSAASKCSRHHFRLTALWIVMLSGFVFVPASCLMHLKTDPILLCTRSFSTSSVMLFRYNSRSAFPLALRMPCKHKS